MSTAGIFDLPAEGAVDDVGAAGFCPSLKMIAAGGSGLRGVLHLDREVAGAALHQRDLAGDARPSKSVASHPLVEPGSAGGGIVRSTATSSAVTSPLPENSIVE